MEMAATMTVTTKVMRASTTLSKENMAPTVKRVDTRLTSPEPLVNGMALPILDADLPSMEVLMEGKVTHLTQTINGHFYEDTQCLLQIGPGCTRLAFV